jgi:hypothetical protein
MTTDNLRRAAELNAPAQSSPSLSEAQALMQRADQLRRAAEHREGAPLPLLRN